MGCKPSKGESTLDHPAPPDLRGALRYIEQEADKTLAQDTGYVSALMLIREIARRAALQQSAQPTITGVDWGKGESFSALICPRCKTEIRVLQAERAAPPAGGEPPRNPACANPECGHGQTAHTCWGECHIDRYQDDALPCSCKAFVAGVASRGGPPKKHCYVCSHDRSFDVECPDCRQGATPAAGAAPRGEGPGAAAVDAWEKAEGESMREGPRYTLERLIDDAVPAAEAAARRAAFEEAERLAHAVLAYDAAIQEAARQGKSWVQDGKLDMLYAEWLSLARAVVDGERARREEGRE